MIVSQHIEPPAEDFGTLVQLRDNLINQVKTLEREKSNIDKLNQTLIEKLKAFGQSRRRQ